MAADEARARTAGPVSTALASHRLPEELVQAYAKRGIDRLYEWQAKCLSVPGVGDGGNLVYCAPTSGGKTMVSEILMLQRVSLLRKRAVFVLPFVSIVTEKTRYLQALCSQMRLSVKGFYGGSLDSAREKFDIGVCTIEKANALINMLVESGSLSESLCCVVVDELHLVGDRSRGYLLEVMLSKLMFLAPEVQILGMSATLPNIDDIKRWLKAELFVESDFRPVPLREYFLVGTELYHADGSFARGLGSGAAASGDPLTEAVWEVTLGNRWRVSSGPSLCVRRRVRKQGVL